MLGGTNNTYRPSGQSSHSKALVETRFPTWCTAACRVSHRPNSSSATAPLGHHVSFYARNHQEHQKVFEDKITVSLSSTHSMRIFTMSMGTRWGARACRDSSTQICARVNTEKCSPRSHTLFDLEFCKHPWTGRNPRSCSVIVDRLERMHRCKTLGWVGPSLLLHGTLWHISDNFRAKSQHVCVSLPVTKNQWNKTNVFPNWVLVLRFRWLLDIFGSHPPSWAIVNQGRNCPEQASKLWSYGLQTVARPTRNLK